MRDREKSRSSIFTLQLIGWGVILCISLLWSAFSGVKTINQYGLAILSFDIIVLIFIYLINYKIFIPRYLFQDKKVCFTIANLVVILLLLIFSYYRDKFGLLDAFRPDDMPARSHTRSVLMFLTRDFINYVLMIGVVTAFKLSERLELSEKALKEAQNARVEAELANLRSQINPHFLLNTLNNIYALTAIDAERAQTTIQQLSNLLRYILYDNLNEKVSLLGEVNFLKSYIELMSIRLPHQVNLTTDFKISPNSTKLIAPLIFISLIENAFKHSVGADGGGFIEILFENRDDSSEVVLAIRNSNNSKKDGDKSGHGIGLEQVKRRLELLYHDKYRWEVTSDEEVYSSVLTIKM